MFKILKYFQLCWLVLGVLTLVWIIILYIDTGSSEAILLCNMIMTTISFPISLVVVFVFPILVKIQEILFPSASIPSNIYAIILNWAAMFVPGLLQWFVFLPYIVKKMTEK